MQNTLVILKPDAIQRRLIGKIITRFEEKGLQIMGLKLMRMTEELARRNYVQHKGRDFYEPLVRFMTSSPVIVLALRGKEVIETVRKMAGFTFGTKAEPGTIRGDYAISNRFNLIHVSDSLETAEREISIFFKKDELLEYENVDTPWVYDLSQGTIV
ncbi:MAG TPA: nucleoside-diphosphate kinase [Candidatus Tripitaka californicus]|uniref:nucleoside-diphosphate kinase n=1 Tax=Candidatus Tripitaka californicus TaxID=3367616 RepID=UPI0040257D27|nr:nucleoside-diphosphate kinase [Planctomycetota bacterium]